MRFYFLFLLIVALCDLLGRGASAQELTATLNLRQDAGQTFGTIDVDETFEVALKNGTQEPILLPDPESAEGFEAIRFVITDSESKQVFDVSRTVDLSNTEKEAIELQPGDDYVFFVALGEFQNGQRLWKDLPAPNSNQIFSIRFELDFKTVSAKSIEYPMQFSFARAELPQHYLWNGFPDVAMKLLKADPQLVHRPDEDQRTPLHVAARSGHTAVVEWLLAHEADVDAVAYNRFTPLRLSSDPEIVRILLQAGANPNHLDAFSLSPLQNAIMESKRGINTDEKAVMAHVAKWKQILNVYSEEGVEFELLPAIEIGDLPQVKKLLTKAPSLLDEHVQTQLPLRSAARNGELEIVRYLLSTFPEKMDIDNFAGGSGYPVCISALGNRNPEVLRLLIEEGADLERRITWQGIRTGRWVVGDNATLLHFATRDGVPETIQLLLDKGVDPFAVARSDLYGGKQTALHVAAIFSKPENLATMLNHDSFQSADQKKQQEVLDECLRISVRPFGTPSPDLCSKLINAGANTIPVPGQPTLIQAVTGSLHPSSDDAVAIGKIVDVFLQAGVEMDLYSAVALHRVEQVEQILQQNPELAATRGTGGVPVLHMATKMGSIKTVRSLLESGCDVNIENQSKSSGDLGERALHQAAFWDREEIAKLLMDSGAEVNALTQDQFTALHHAARMGNVSIVKLLMENGADPTIADHRGQTPADWARSSKIKQLLQPKESE